MARRSEHSHDEIKRMVLEASETIISEEGFAALTVRRIALEIGYTVGSIYMVFENMADLILHVNARTLDDLSRALDEISPAAGLEQTVVDLAKAYLNFSGSNFNRWRLIFEHQLPKNAEIPSWYQRKADAAFYRVESLFRQLNPDLPEIEIRAGARALWGGVHGICILSLTGKSAAIELSDVESSIILLVENFLQGWKAR